MADGKKRIVPDYDDIGAQLTWSSDYKVMNVNFFVIMVSFSTQTVRAVPEVGVANTPPSVQRGN